MNTYITNSKQGVGSVNLHLILFVPFFCTLMFCHSQEKQKAESGLNFKGKCNKMVKETFT